MAIGDLESSKARLEYWNMFSTEWKQCEKFITGGVTVFDLFSIIRTASDDEQDFKHDKKNIPVYSVFGFQEGKKMTNF